MGLTSRLSLPVFHQDKQRYKSCKMKSSAALAIFFAMVLTDLTAAAPANNDPPTTGISRRPFCPVCFFRCPPCKPCPKRLYTSEEDTYTLVNSQLEDRQVATGPFVGCPPCSCPKCPIC